MNDTENISDVTGDTFETAVVERSHQVPVLVDYWADWCGPCQMQMPVLRKLVEEMDGNFQLAKVNTDEQRELASAHGIRSLPTMRLYKDGAVVEEILGAQTEATLRLLLDRHIERESDRARQRAREEYAQGHADAALELLRQAHQADPGNHRVTLDYAELCMQEGRLEEAEENLSGLPRDIRDEPEGMRLRALLDFAVVTGDAPSLPELEDAIASRPDDLEAHYQLAARYVLAGRHEEAMDAFMHILRRDRKFREDAGRRGLLAVFDLLGNEGELVSRYRRELFNAMH